MKNIINNRKISLVHYGLEENWQAELPSEDWLCIFVVSDTPGRYVNEGISKIINKDVAYVCTVGPESEKVHDLIDEEIGYRSAEIENLHLPNHHIITTWHNDLDNGIRFGLIAAQHNEVEIKSISILDFTGGINEDDIQKSIKRIATEM